MVISILCLISGVLTAANSVRVEKAPPESSWVSSVVSVEADEKREVKIELLSKYETFQLGKQIFGGKAGLAALGSGFSQKAPGATYDSLPDLDTKTPPSVITEHSHGGVSEIRTQIIELIDKPDLSDEMVENLEANLHFLINQKNEIVVLMVETDNDFVDQYLKSKLNYKKLLTDSVGVRYNLKVTIKNG